MKFYLLFFVFVTLFTNCVDVADKNLGGNYKLAVSANYFEGWEVLTIDNMIAIKSKVKEYAYDSMFILVKQYPVDSILGIDTMNYPQLNEAIKKNTFYQYWIIDKSQKNVIILDGRFSNIYGPFKTKEYLEKLQELNVSKKLVLKQDPNMF